MADVLLVEDEHDMAARLQGALAGAGFAVTVAHTDDEAHDCLERAGAAFAILVTDIDLGAGVTGFDIARRARQLNPGLTVIYLTGDAGDLARFGVEGALLFPKPFDPLVLADRLRRLADS
jgi:DNA-binding response OmpR family regulator